MKHKFKMSNEGKRRSNSSERTTPKTTSLVTGAAVSPTSMPKKRKKGSTSSYSFNNFDLFN